MRPIHTTKRLYSIAPLKSARTPTSTPRPRRTSLSLASVVSSPPSSPPGQSNVSVSSSSGSRSYYTGAAGSLHSAPPPPPLTPSRPSGSNPINSPRVSFGEHLGEAGSSQNGNAHSTSPTTNPGSGTNSAQSSHSPNTSQSQLAPNSPNSQSSQHGQTSNGSGQQGEGLYQYGPTTFLTVDGPSPQSSSSPPDHGFFLPGPRTGLVSNSAWRPREGALDNTERSTKDASDSVPKSTFPQKIYQLEVGAYGFPKRGRGRESIARPTMRSTTSSSSNTCPKCIEEQAAAEENEDWAYSTDHLEYAVQVGEDAYFVRDDALGVADGVGGWASRHHPRTSAMHECNICSTASSSRDHKHQHQLYLHTHLHSHSPSHMQSHRPRPHRPVQPSPSALFARRLMHFCSHEVGEAQARVRQSKSTSSSGSPGSVPMNFTAPSSRSTSPSPSPAPAQRTPVSMGPSLRNGGISPSPTQRVRGLQKTVVREPREPNREVRHFGNARPFAWPWDDKFTTHYDHADLNEDAAVGSGSPGLGILLEEEGADHNHNTTTYTSATKEKKVHPTSTATPTQKELDSSSAELNDNPGVVTKDPLEGTIDPVEVLERAYEKTIEAHRVRRRVRVVKENERKSTSSSPSARWWSYGSALGLSSSPPPFPLTPPQTPSQQQRQRQRQRQTQLESVDVDYEWLDTYEPLTAGSSTALLAVLSGDRLRVAHLGDCVGWLVRAGEIVWRSEEMWWGFNYPVQLGPSSPTQPSDARRYELAVQADDILILASDGVSDNCWEEDVLDEVRRAVEVHSPLSQPQHQMGNANAKDGGTATEKTRSTDLLGRRTLAGMLSEALCSRARQLSMQGRSRARTGPGAPRPAAATTTSDANTGVNSNGLDANANAKGTKLERTTEIAEEELPFERRAREEGRRFRGGKSDDISVLVAIISPVPPSPHDQVAVASAGQSENGAKTTGETAAA